MSLSTLSKIKTVAIIGNPNCGKSTLFNSLTGLKQKVANYPGVTVEKKIGKIFLKDNIEINLIDLPGSYSLFANSPDEEISSKVLLGLVEETPKPDLVLCVIDATNIERNLYLVSQIIDLRLPVILVLNMIDIATQENIKINKNKLSALLDLPIIETVAPKYIGIEELKNEITKVIIPSTSLRKWYTSNEIEHNTQLLSKEISISKNISLDIAHHYAVQLLSSTNISTTVEFSKELISIADKIKEKMSFLDIDLSSIFIESRYHWIKSVCNESIIFHRDDELTFSDKIDKVLTHKYWGFIIFISILSLIFQSIFTWAVIPMNLIGSAINLFSTFIESLIPAGQLQQLIVNGIIAGVGAVVTFVPQIFLLFIFIGILEDSGYMSRAAFIMDKLMSKVGLHGKSFIPMLSSFACAIPGIMATRTIENKKDRLVTILVVPLMSCSARIPVYTLLIAAFIPQYFVFGIFYLPGLVMISMYLLGLVAALCMAWLFKKTLLRGDRPIFIMELPPYKLPSVKTLFLHAWERVKLFLKRAGTIILGISIILWFLATYPNVNEKDSSKRLKNSFIGQAGQLIEPLIKPLGFNWKIGVGLITSLLQREVFVSTMGVIYKVDDSDISSQSLQENIKNDIDETSGNLSFTPLIAICVMIYYVLAMQCMSTLAVVRRETNSWKWPIFQFCYMTILAYSVTFFAYRFGLFLGFT
ncbi:MAG: ferrous iron transport protein B [Ignavibacteria bacterium]|nr:ferrous iron transport protein B [Bacteroidota bacterium]MSQ45752.1 ferrous iron transport protein B [Ignavibacteria bacterium]